MADSTAKLAWVDMNQGETDHSAPVLLLHGFTQNSNTWGRFGELLSASFRLRAVDLPGHGHSFHDEVSLMTAGRLVGSLLDDPENDKKRWWLVGYSMGGRIALHTIVQHARSVAGLVLIGAHPGLSNASERARRLQQDQRIAARIRAEPLDEFLASWLANPMFARLSHSSAKLNGRLRNRSEGLAASLSKRGLGSQADLREPLLSTLAEHSIPLLYIAGCEDRRYGTIGLDLVDTATRAGVRAAEAVELRGGHAIHLEQPDATAKTVTKFITNSVIN